MANLREEVHKACWLHAHVSMCKYAFRSVCRVLSVAILMGDLHPEHSKCLVCVALTATTLSNHSNLSLSDAKLISQVWRCMINHLQSSRKGESVHSQSCHSERSSQTLSQDLWPFGSDWLSAGPDECTVKTWPPSESGPPGGRKWSSLYK